MPLPSFPSSKESALRREVRLKDSCHAADPSPQAPDVTLCYHCTPHSEHCIDTSTTVFIGYSFSLSWGWQTLHWSGQHCLKMRQSLEFFILISFSHHSPFTFVKPVLKICGWWVGVCLERARLKSGCCIWLKYIEWHSKRIYKNILLKKYYSDLQNGH